MIAEKIEWTPALHALVLGWAPRIVASLDEGLAHARALKVPAVEGDICAWCFAGTGRPPRLYMALPLTHRPSV